MKQGTSETRVFHFVKFTISVWNIRDQIYLPSLLHFKYFYCKESFTCEYFFAITPDVSRAPSQEPQTNCIDKMFSPRPLSQVQIYFRSWCHHSEIKLAIVFCQALSQSSLRVKKCTVSIFSLIAQRPTNRLSKFQFVPHCVKNISQKHRWKCERFGFLNIQEAPSHNSQSSVYIECFAEDNRLSSNM